MRILLFGGRGYMGQQFLKIYPDALTPHVDIADPAAVAGVLDREKPDVVINAAGKNGVPNVDWCEDHKAETMHANVLGPIVLAEECGKRGIYWVHLSSGCIFAGDNGGSGYAETDEPNFTGSFYSRTKAMAERAVREFPNILILRLRMPFDGVPHPKNLITKLAKYAKVNDEENSITCLTDFLPVVQDLIARRKDGIFNATNEGAISPHHIMELYREIVDSAHRFERLPLSAQASVTKVGRSNCLLSTEKMKHEGLSLRPIEEAVRDSLLKYKENLFMKA